MKPFTKPSELTKWVRDNATGGLCVLLECYAITQIGIIYNPFYLPGRTDVYEGIRVIPVTVRRVPNSNAL